MARSVISVFLRACLAAFAIAVGDAEAASDQFQGTLLVADEVEYDPEIETIEAVGNVEIYSDGRRLTADSVIYRGREDHISVVGPLTIYDEASGARTYASLAETSADMQNFVLASARHLMKDQLQIVSTQMRRSEGRYTEWRLVTASYCQVCANRPTPLWELRAQSAMHDQEKRMIYLRNAQFRVAGVPIAYLPYLRLPDPSLERADGFLRASTQSSSLHGTTLRLPYFITLGDHADLTLTPNFGISGNADALETLEARYRRLFATGGIELNGAIGRPKDGSNDYQSYLFANGEFSLPSDFELAFQIQDASNRTYLSQRNFFGGSTETFTGVPLRYDTDTLISSLDLSRSRSNEFLKFSSRLLQTQRDPSTVTDHPSSEIDAEYTRWFDLDGLPGELTFNTVVQAEYNDFDLNNSRQRDIERAFLGFGWRESWDIGSGLVLDGELAKFWDNYRIYDDPGAIPDQRTSQGLAVVALRWPWEKTRPDGTRVRFEPFLRQIAFRGNSAVVPDTNGTIDEFDPKNRFDLKRFRRIDRPTNLDISEVGFDYDVAFSNGWTIGGRAERDFLWNIANGGYDGGALYTGRLGYNRSGLSATGSLTFNSDLELVRNTALLSYAWNDVQFQANYTRSEVDLDLGSTVVEENGSANLSWTIGKGLTLLSSVTVDRSRTDSSFAAAGFNFDNGDDWSSTLLTNYSIDDAEIDTHEFSLVHELDWGGVASFRYDFDRNAQSAIGVGIDYINECVNFQGDLLRRESMITSEKPAFELSISVELGGFSKGRGRRCG